MCVQNHPLQEDKISDGETYTRWVYAPRYIDERGVFKQNFVSLKEWNKEKGISGQIIDRCDHKTVLLWGLHFRRKDKDGTEKEERFLGYAKALACKIRSVADEDGDKIDVIFTESDVPFHAEIRFEIDGELVVGNNQHPRFLRYKDKLRDILQNDVYRASAEELAEIK